MSIIIALAEFSSRILVFLAYNWEKFAAITLVLSIAYAILSYFENEKPDGGDGGVEKDGRSSEDQSKTNEVQPEGVPIEEELVLAGPNWMEVAR